MTVFLHVSQQGAAGGQGPTRGPGSGATPALGAKAPAAIRGRRSRAFSMGPRRRTRGSAGSIRTTRRSGRAELLAPSPTVAGGGAGELRRSLRSHLGGGVRVQRVLRGSRRRADPLSAPPDSAGRLVPGDVLQRRRAPRRRTDVRPRWRGVGPDHGNLEGRAGDAQRDRLLQLVRDRARPQLLLRHEWHGRGSPLRRRNPGDPVRNAGSSHDEPGPRCGLRSGLAERLDRHRLPGLSLRVVERRGASSPSGGARSTGARPTSTTARRASSSSRPETPRC